MATDELRERLQGLSSELERPRALLATLKHSIEAASRDSGVDAELHWGWIELIETVDDSLEGFGRHLDRLAAWKPEGAEDE
jgi:hypothetical protein